MNLIECAPCNVQRLADSTIFYFGAGPNTLQELPADSEFVMVYSPANDTGWESVKYTVLSNQRGYSVLERRSLEPEEISYFECLLRTPY